ncbi:MAG: hypothetical protein EKK57_02780 [Proteobacteria bacterium]|nr:MAG: hypothetical protein EKK57_02780 [Pseudomonadota bacterium]
MSALDSFLLEVERNIKPEDVILALLKKSSINTLQVDSDIDKYIQKYIDYLKLYTSCKKSIYYLQKRLRHDFIGCEANSVLLERLRDIKDQSIRYKIEKNNVASFLIENFEIPQSYFKFLNKNL